MVNAQEYINEKYLNKEERARITYLDISSKNLEGELDLKDFKNLKSLHCHSNELTNLKISENSSLEDLGCHFNKLTSMDFLKTLNTKKLTYLNIGDNDFSEQDLSLFGELDFASLKLLYLHDNKFKGSLKPLEKMNNLILVDISNTNIDSGLDSNFSYNLETFRFLSEREDNKGYLEIKNKLKEYGGGDDCYYDFSQWRENQDKIKKKHVKEIENILIIGRTGSGKSTLANVLSKVDEFEESEGFASMTSKAKAKTFKYKGINYQIIDTVGLGDTKLKKEELLEKFAKDTDDYIGKGILQILLVMDGRLTEDVLTDYLWLSSFLFDKRVFDHTTIVRTKFGKFKNEGSCKKVTEELVKLNEEINKEVNKEINEKVISKGRIVYVNNPEINDEESDEELVKSNEKLRRKSREILLDYLGTLDSEDYEPMNGEKLERKFNQLKTNLDEWINQLSEKNKTLLGNFIERHQEKWAESFSSDSDYSELKKDLKKCREVLKKDSFLNEGQVDRLFDKLKKLVKLNKEIEAGNWVNKTIEEEKKILDELRINCETDAKGVVDVKRKNSIRELLEWQEKFTREEQGKKSNTLQEQLNKAKRNLRGLFLSEEKIEGLSEQKKKIIKLEILAKTLKETKRFEIQWKILDYLQMKQLLTDNNISNILLKKSGIIKRVKRVEEMDKKIAVRVDIGDINNAFKRSKEGESVSSFIPKLDKNDMGEFCHYIFFPLRVKTSNWGILALHTKNPSSSFYTSSSQDENSIKEETKIVESFFHEMYKESAKDKELKCIIPKTRQSNSRDSGVFAYWYIEKLINHYQDKDNKFDFDKLPDILSCEEKEMNDYINKFREEWKSVLMDRRQKVEDIVREETQVQIEQSPK